MSPAQLPVSLIEATRSGEIRGANLAVYIELHEWLDLDEFRTVTPWCIAKRLKLSERRVYQAIDALSERDYLVAGNRSGNARTFRIAVANSRS